MPDCYGIYSAMRLVHQRQPAGSCQTCNCSRAIIPTATAQFPAPTTSHVRVHPPTAYLYTQVYTCVCA